MHWKRLMRLSSFYRRCKVSDSQWIDSERVTHLFLFKGFSKTHLAEYQAFQLEADANFGKAIQILTEEMNNRKKSLEA